MRGQLPVLEKINGNFIRLLEEGFEQMLQRPVEIEEEGLQTVRTNDYIHSLGLPVSLNFIEVPPLQGEALVAFDPAMVFAIVTSPYRLARVKAFFDSETVAAASWQSYQSLVAIGSGGPFGAEGPIIMTGGAIGSLLAQHFHLSAAERKALLVAGAAAGLRRCLRRRCCCRKPIS